MNNSDQQIKTSSYAADAPISDSADDRFRRWPFAQRIAQTIISRTDHSSIVIGIYGAWGEGKTSVLNFIEKELSQHPSEVVCVRFNPWRFRDEATLLISFFSTLAVALGRSISSPKEKIGEMLQKYGELLAPLSVSFLGLGLSPGKATAETGKLLSSVDLEDLKNRIENILNEENKRVVIIMDDIDRLDKEEIQAVFRLVKLSADFSYTAYILSFDEKMVTAALEERYAGSEESGQGFLEKIVQVPLHLPPADQISLRDFCFRGVNEALDSTGIFIPKEQADQYVRHFVEGIEPRLQTPRMCKRYANALIFALPILKDEVNPVDLMLIEGIRVFYPALYKFIRKNRDLFAGTISTGQYDQQKNKEIEVRKIDGTLEEFAQDAIYAKTLLMTLFPKLKGLYGNMHYGSDWEKGWANEKRVSSKDYFDRYFSYAIPAGDVPDHEIEELIGLCNNAKIEVAKIKLKELLTEWNAEKVIRKLRYMENSLTPIISMNLGKVLAISGNEFPNPDGLFSFMMPFTQACILIAQLAKNIVKGKQRLDYGKEVISISTPLFFTVQCLQWFCADKEEQEGERIFHEKEEAILGKLAAKRIYRESKDSTIYIKYGKDTPLLLWAWAYFGSKKATETHIIKSLGDKPETVLDLLISYVGTAWEMTTGLPRKGDFRRENYNSLSVVVDPGIIYSFVRKVYGPQVENARGKVFEYRDRPFAEKLVLQFASIHHYVKEEKSKADLVLKEPIENETMLLSADEH
jgi:predicted KAP-like P-loop ATPase